MQTQTMTATDARNNFFPLLKEIAQNHGHTKIKTRSGDVMVLSSQEYEELLETAELSTIPNFHTSLKEADEDVKKNNVYTLEEAFSL